MSDDGIFLVDCESMRFVDVNAAATRNIGFSRNELLSMGPQDLFRIDRSVIEREYAAVIAADDAGVRTERVAMSKEGRRVESEMHRRAVNVGGRWIIVSIAHEITRRKDAERKLRRLGQMFAVLSATNESILRARTHHDLYSGIYDAAVQDGGMITAAFLLPERQRISPDRGGQARSGIDRSGFA
jgi:PAS domain S-box-containing protein